MRFLFQWKCANISWERRQELFQSCYSTCSVKCVSQWFQIISNGRLKTYQHTKQQTQQRYEQNKQIFDKRGEYTFHSIECPIAMFYGSSDTLINHHIEEIFQLIREECLVFIHCEEKYEHLDLIWADDVAVTIYPKIIQQLQIYHQNTKTTRNEKEGRQGGRIREELFIN